jgi:hypothetical protein
VFTRFLSLDHILGLVNPVRAFRPLSSHILISFSHLGAGFLRKFPCLSSPIKCFYTSYFPLQNTCHDHTTFLDLISLGYYKHSAYYVTSHNVCFTLVFLRLRKEKFAKTCPLALPCLRTRELQNWFPWRFMFASLMRQDMLIHVCRDVGCDRTAVTDTSHQDLHAFLIAFLA